LKILKEKGRKMFDLKFSKKSMKFLSKCDENLYKRLNKKVNELKENPFPSDSKRVVNRKEKTFRVRVGDFRILYSFYQNKNLIFISDIDKRPRAY